MCPNTAKFIPCLSQMLEGFGREDGPVKKKMPVEVDVPEFLVDCGMQSSATEKVKAVGDLSMIAFYYLLRVGEYTVKATRNHTKRTVQFRLQDVTFFGFDESGRLVQLPRNAPDHVIMNAMCCTLTLDNQKNGWKGISVSHWSNGDKIHNPTKAIARRYCHIRRHTSDYSTFLSSYWEEGTKFDINNKDISEGLKRAAEALNYPLTRGIPISSVDTHSLRIGGANALSLNGYSKKEIQKMGRWRGETFLEYIREGLADFSKGMSTSMRKNFGFVSLEGGVYNDVTPTIIDTPYNDNVSGAAAA